MIKQTAILIELGFDRFSKLTKAEREKLSDIIGTVGGGSLGFASITAAVSSLGTVAGLSGSGIVSGLAAIGALVEGGMLAGVLVAAAIPVAGAGAGYALIRTVKYFIDESKLNATALDPRWETPLRDVLG